tara:strand:- start:7688 stop:8098 length:411 start_codon:yes stop_codon:yes gene_type:complete
MTGILQSLWTFALAALGSVLNLLAAVLDLAGGVLYHLHVDAPRLEGLIVGVALAWLLSRRDKHPLLRALSAPLKLVIDILDLAWDQCAEVVKDVWGVAWGSVTGSVGWVRGKASNSYKIIVQSLGSARDSLRRKKE